MKRPTKPNPAKLAQQCDDFNLRVPVGSAVTVTRDNGDKEETVTRSEAYVMGGHSAVIFLGGIPGCYLLDRVQPLGQFHSEPKP